MTVSRDEAVAFLSRLAASSSRLLAVLATRFGVFSFECSIATVTPDIITLEQKCDPLAGEALLPYPSWFSIAAGTQLSYGDIREAKTEDRPYLQQAPFGPIVGALTIYFSDTEALVLVERDSNPTV